MTAAPTYPFAALVGLDTLKLALQLAAIDPRLSVLLRGDKGSGKSTAARGLAALLTDGAPFVTLPIGTTEDRLLGGLDVERTLKGEPALKPGLVARAHGGVLYIDEVNLLADHLADALLDAAASRVLVVEREGFSVAQAAEFVLMGSMNPEEGALRPQLLDRFALAVDVTTPMEPATRAEVLHRRLAFDRDPLGFATSWAAEQEALARRAEAARMRVTATEISAEGLRDVSARVAAHGVRSLRADLAAVRASRAYAALLGDPSVTSTHIDAVLPLALAHRLPHGSRPPAPPPESPGPVPPPTRDEETTNDRDESVDGSRPERVFPPLSQPAPRVTLDARAAGAGTTHARGGPSVGPAITARRTDTPAEVDLRASVVHAVARTGAATLSADDLHERVRAPRASIRFILVVDASGSHAVAERMRLVKGVASGLLDASHGRHDEIVVIACRGPRAEVLVEPTSSRDEAERALEYLPTGGRTPLAHGLELAAGYVTDRAMAIVITDGRANVPTRTEDAWNDTQQAARALRCPALVIDTEDSRSASGRPQQLAEALGGRHARIDALDAAQVLTLVHEAS